MINDLIKRCQGFENFKNCEDCGYYCDDEYNELFCLQELIVRYNKKYNVNYKLIDYDRFREVKQLLNEC